LCRFALPAAAAYIDGAASPLNPRNTMTELASQDSSADASVDASVDSGEVAKFSALAAEWWDPNGKFAPLHKFNPVRLGFIRQEAAARFGRDARSLRPFEGLSLLDIGCGGGLLSEPMARLGFAVTGADASEKNIGTARAHAASSAVTVDYRAATAEALAAEGRAFDVVLNMEVVEHVADVGAYLSACTRLVKPGGFTIVATLNKTLKSLALAKFAAEYVLGWMPRGTHDWNRFIAPAQLQQALEKSGLSILKTQGVFFNLLTWDWRLSSDTDVNYMMVASKL
jgi:2-polyprenyl-6-hydroxyphenyl methylase / 3-demethylubiquinone-9 3-methyltransferase